MTKETKPEDKQPETKVPDEPKKPAKVVMDKAKPPTQGGAESYTLASGTVVTHN